MSPLSWRHQTLIQALLSRGPLREDDFRSIFSQVTKKSSGSQQQLFNEYLRMINAQLGYAQLELRACRNQYDGGVYYGVVNNVSDDQSKLGTNYTVPQIAFYKGIVRTMSEQSSKCQADPMPATEEENLRKVAECFKHPAFVQGLNAIMARVTQSGDLVNLIAWIINVEAIIQDAEASGCISNTDALNIRLETQTHGVADSESQEGPSQIPPAFKNFSMSQKEKTLEKLQKDKWLSSTPDGKVGIGVRSFLDLRSWFRTNDVPTCEVCNEAAVKAQLCQNDACNARLHQYCLEKKFSQQRVEKVCPTCGTQWPGFMIKAEAVEISDEPNVHSQNTQPRGSPVKRRRRMKREYHADVAGSDSCVTSAVISDRKRVTRSSARL
ncbi:hypothetical protein OROHE_024128 [Orobanche hederae]